MKRKVRKPRVVRMWAVWYDDLPGPAQVFMCRSSCWLRGPGLRVVRVEVREVPKKKGKGNRRA